MSALATATSSLSRDKLDLLKRTIAKGSTDDEFGLFVATAERLGLDPFARQIFAVKRFDSKERREVMSIQCSIDGFRAVAERTGELDGQEGPYWCGSDGVWHDVWLERGEPRAAKVVVYRRGASRGFVGLAHIDEYRQTRKDRDSGDMVPSGLWGKMPALMLAKCAEALALRKAFPSQLSGVYTSDEMSQSIDAEGEMIVESRDPKRREPSPRQLASGTKKTAPEMLSDEKVGEIEKIVLAAGSLDELEPLRKRAAELKSQMTREQKLRVSAAIKRTDDRLNGVVPEEEEP